MKRTESESECGEEYTDRESAIERGRERKEKERRRKRERERELNERGELDRNRERGGM
jgi:hypothetical protein